MMSLGEEWGGRAQAENMIRGKGLSLILKTMEIQFRRPVTFPDTVSQNPSPLASHHLRS
jgi:acyl-CoA thioesterase FadM